MFPCYFQPLPRTATLASRSVCFFPAAGFLSFLRLEDISCEVGSSEYQAALEDWKAQGRRAAEALFAESGKSARGEWWRPAEARRLGTRDFLLSMP